MIRKNQANAPEQAEDYATICAPDPGAATEVLGTGITMIPYSAKLAIGSIFEEGKHKYGKDNWKKGEFDLAYQEERAEHAMNHFEQALELFEKRKLTWEPGIREEEITQLAKVGWFIVTQIDTLRRELKAVEEQQKAEEELDAMVEELRKNANSSAKKKKKIIP